MNLIYSCVFVNENYIKLLENLIQSYDKFNKNSDICYLIITHERFESAIKKSMQNIDFKKYDIWLLDVCNSLTNKENIYEATCMRYYIYDYPKIKQYQKILYLDCDIIVLGNLDGIFDVCIEDMLYFVHEKMHRYNHCSLFTDEEYNNLSSNSSFTTAIMLFNNKNIVTKYLENIYIYIKEFKSIFPNPLPAYDQPIVNKLCIYKQVSNNTMLNNLCFNMAAEDTEDNIILLYNSNYKVVHFATKVGDCESKLERSLFVQELINM